MKWRLLFYPVMFLLPVLMTSCEEVDDDIDRHAGAQGTVDVRLEDVAKILAGVPLQACHMDEVRNAAGSSSANGYDEEYTMRDLFEAPGRGVGDMEVRGGAGYDTPLRDLIVEQVKTMAATKSADAPSVDAESFIAALSSSDVQIYWPYSESWNGKDLPVITFDPEDNSDRNIGYRIAVNDDGSRRIEEVTVDEGMAAEEPVWVVNRNSDAGFKTLEMLRREDPDWGEGGGSIIVMPSATAHAVKAPDEKPLKTLLLKDFTMNRNYDSWFAGASEFFVKTGSLEDFTASTEAELKLYNPMVTDFMIVVKRSQLGIPQPFNAVLISDWTEQMTHCAFMITEDDGGTRTEWKCTALVRIASKSYGVEISLPFNSRDDIVWRGQLAGRWIEANSNIVGHFGDVDLTFEVLEY
ncbi:MAG: hypothetical protein E7118_06605 [Bacteroidales bacterium]|nr:hypothetical protein [Bacteroidales bacterium]